MDSIFLTGIVGALILVTGAAYPIKKVSHPAKSAKNWLFALGGAVMLLYSLWGYLNGGPVFFVFLQCLVVIASILMMFDVPDSIDIPIITLLGIGLVAWSLLLFEGYETIFFIIGLSGIGLGYALEMGTLRRNLALTLGSALIALFSYVVASWIFCWLNVFFAIFSLYHVIQIKKRSVVVAH